MIYIALTLLGLALGSFTNALVWRLHEQELLKKKKKPNKKKLAELSISRGRSMCPRCEHALAWYDLLPVFSWLMVRGKCRYCKKPISAQYPLVELLAAGLLSLTFYFWPYALSNMAGILAFAVWTIIIVIFLALFVYDLKWMVLPNRLMYPLFLSVIAFQVLQIAAGSHAQHAIVSGITASVLGSLIFGGFFWIIYQISNGSWIGGGDVRLGFALGILLGWQKSLLCLASAAYLGSAVILVLVIMGRYHRKLKLPFGPFLITAAVFTILWGQQIIDWYKRLSGL